MSENEPKPTITENGQQSALRSAQILRPTDPEFADCLAYYAEIFPELGHELENRYLIVAADKYILDTFTSEIEGLEIAADVFDNERVIVHKINQIGIPKSKIYIAGFEVDLYTILEERNKGNLKPNITGTIPTSIQLFMRLEARNAAQHTTTTDNQSSNPPLLRN